MLSLLLSVIVVYLVWELYKCKKLVNQQFQKAKDAQEEAIYGRKLVRINSKKVKNLKRISS